MPEKFKCAKCGCLWLRHEDMTFSLADANQKPCEICDNSPFMVDNLQRVLDPEATVPGAQIITQEMSDESIERTSPFKDGNAQGVVDLINEEAASGRKPGSPAGDDTVGNNDNS